MSSLDKGVSPKPPKKVRLNRFSQLLDMGENPGGLMVQTPNGTSRADGKQQETVYNVNTDRWTKNGPWSGDMSGS